MCRKPKGRECCCCRATKLNTWVRVVGIIVAVIGIIVALVT